MQWRPAHEAHAIEACSATLQFNEAIPVKRWQALLEEVSAKASGTGFNTRQDHVELPMPLVLPGFPFPMQAVAAPGPPPVMPVQMPPGSGVPTGRVLRVMDDSGVREQLLLRRDQFAYTSSRYLGWTSFKRQVQGLLAPALDNALQLVNLNVVKLEYWDRFIYDGGPEDVQYAQLLRTGSHYVPSFPAGTSQLWHSHVGFFLPGGSPARKLVNLNADVMDAPETPDATQPPVLKRMVNIYSMAQDVPPANLSPGSYVETASVLDELHAILKGMLAEVITEEVAQRISLTV